MTRNWLSFGALLLAAPMALPMPAAAQKAAPAPLDNDQQRVLDLLNRGIALDNEGKTRDAEAIYRRWIDEVTRRYGADSPITGLGYRALAGNLTSQNRLADAEPMLRRVVEINRAAFGDQAEETIDARAGLAGNYARQGRPAEALPLRRVILAAQIARAGERSAAAVIAGNNLANTLIDLGQFREAETLLRKAVETSTAIHGRNHAETASSYGNLAMALRSMGRYADATPLLQDALAIDRALSGEENAVVALRHYNIAANLGDQGRYQEASVEARSALDIWRRTKGEDSPEAALGYTGVGFMLSGLGRYGDAQGMYRRALDIRVKTLGERHPSTAEAYNNIAQNMSNMGQPAPEVEPILRKALDINRAALGDESTRTALAYANVANNLDLQGRYTEAEALYRRALDINGRINGRDHPSYATTLINLGQNLRSQEKIAAAEPLIRQALGIFQAKFGDTNPDTGWAYSILGSTLGDLGRYDEGADMARRALDIRRQTLGEDHPLTAVAYNNLAAAITLKTGGDREAEAPYRQALAILLRSVGESHIDTAQAYNSLSSNLRRQGRHAASEEASAKAVAILRGLRSRAGGGALALARLDRQQADPDRNIFTNYMNAAFELMSGTPTAAGQSALQDKAFMAAQDAIASASGRAILQSAARNAAKSTAMAEAVRREQDLVARANLLDRNLLQALSERKSVDAARLRGELDAVQVQLTDASALIDRRYPQYRELVAPRPIGLAEAQRALRPGEGLLLMTEASNVIHVFVVTPNAVVWSRPSAETNAILRQIADLRCDVDSDNCSTTRQAELERLPQTPMERTGHPRFDLTTANALYQTLIAPFEPHLKDVTRLYVASSGKLGDLPLAMLVTAAPPPGADFADPDVLARAQWLSDRYAFTSLPAVAALTLGDGGGRSTRARAFRGFGDPVLTGGDGGSRAASGIGLFTAVTRDGVPLADPALLKTMPPLPGTRIELNAMARLFGQPGNSLTLGAAATETAIRTDPRLASSEVIAIATHGVLPDPQLGLSEPGLVFTPPATPTEEDDGLLTASEAARLNLTADWVVLSACNTASAQGSGGSDSLSALARGFLYAGARGLLASHWRVPDEATAVLTVQTLGARRRDAATTRSLALQAGMRAVRTGKLADGTAVPGWQRDWAHPTNWAAFTTISYRDD